MGDTNADRINSDLIDQFLDYKVKFYHMKAKTHDDYKLWIQAFTRFIGEREENLATCSTQSIADYLHHLRTKRTLRNGTIYAYMASISSFYTWASHPTVEVIPKSPMPPLILENGSRHPNTIPTAADILKIRSSQNAKSIQQAAIFEILLSGGLRVSELTQLRCCDIDFNPLCKDYELDKPSPFVGGSIDLSSGRGIRLKCSDGRRRLTFISKLAAKVVRLHMAKQGLPEESNLPVFPIKSKGAWDAVVALGYGVMSKKPSYKSKTRQEGHLDIDIDSIEGNDDYKDRLRRLQDAERKKQITNPIRQELVRIEPPRKSQLHPHCLRHFFSVMMYYRNYYGNRRDLVTVRDMLGHASTEQSNTYVTGDTYIENDHQWKRIMFGNGFDYKRFEYL